MSNCSLNLQNLKKSEIAFSLLQFGWRKLFHMGASNECDYKHLQRWYGDCELHPTASILLYVGHKWHRQWSKNLDATIGRSELRGQIQSRTLRRCRTNQSASNASGSIRFTHARHNMSIKLDREFDKSSKLHRHKWSLFLSTISAADRWNENKNEIYSILFVQTNQHLF